MKLLSYILVLVSFSASAATTYYVDFGAGSDANAGTATGTAWKHLPGDPNATGNPASASINGDTIYLKGGVHYLLTSGLSIGSARYSSSGARIISGDLNSWGTGRAVIDANNTSQTWAAINQQNISIKGVEFTSTLYVGNQDSGILFSQSGQNVAGCILDSCWIHDASTNGSGDGQDCIEIDGSSVTVTNCRVWNSTQKCIEIYSATAGGCIVANNVLYNATDHVLVISEDNTTAYGNVISNGAVNVGTHTAKVPSSGIKIVGRGTGNTPSANTNLVYNNIISHCSIGILVEDSGAGPMWDNKIFNNTIIDSQQNNTDTDGAIQFNPFGSPINRTRIANNIVYAIRDNGVGRIGIRCITSTSGSGNIIDHNLWADPSGVVQMMKGNASGTVSLANFCDNGSTSPDLRFASTGSGCSFSSVNQIFNSNPLFVSYPGNLYLQNGSPCNAAGTNLSAYFTTDFAGNTRNQWSIGAFESPADPAIVQQPVDQSVVVGAVAIFAVIASGNSALSYQWVTNGVNVVTGGTGSSWTTPVTVLGDNNMTVLVRVTDGGGTVSSVTVHLFVTAGGAVPVISQQPQSVTIGTNQNATFTVQANGTLPLTYLWSLNGVNIATATTSTYTTNGVPIGASGNSYTVGITNAFGGVLSSPAILTVTLPSPGVGTLKIGTGKVGTMHLPGP